MEQLGTSSKRFTAMYTVCLIALPVLVVTATVTYQNSSFDLFSGFVKARKVIWDDNAQRLSARIVGGVLRNISATYKENRAGSIHGEAPSILVVISSYISLSESETAPSKRMCRYLVWNPSNGLGNRMISLVAALLYSVLTDRVLLAEFKEDVEGLFCEPFPNSSWVSPNDFPCKHRYNRLPTYESLLKRNISSETSTDVPPFLLLSLGSTGLGHEYFHCDHSQPLSRGSTGRNYTHSTCEPNLDGHPSTAILVASLHKYYSENLSSTYWWRPTVMEGSSGFINQATKGNRSITTSTITRRHWPICAL